MADQDYNGTSQQTYLYHKEQVMRRRMTAPSGSPDPRKGPARDSTHFVLRRHLRVTAIVLVGMALVLGAAGFVIRKAWTIRKAMTTRERERIVEQMPPADAAQPLPAQLTEIEAVREGGAGHLDTSAFRQAILLGQQGKNKAERGDFAAAIPLYREALDIWPHLSSVWADLGQAHLALRDYGQAQSALERAVTLDASQDALNDLGVTYMHQNKLEEAISLFSTVLELDAEYADAYFNLALCEMVRNRTDAARAHLQTYLLYRPGDARGLKELAYFDALAGDYDGALAKIEAAIEDEPAWGALFFDGAAACALKGDLTGAYGYLLRVLDVAEPHVVYRIYQQSVFRELRLTDYGTEFEKRLAARARSRMGSFSSETAGPDEHDSPRPIFSLMSDRKEL